MLALIAGVGFVADDGTRVDPATLAEYEVMINSDPEETCGHPEWHVLDGDTTVDGGAWDVQADDSDDWDVQADRALADRGWQRTGDWFSPGSTCYTYAPVVRA